MKDLRHALRAIVRMPVLAAVVVGSLGIGIGMNTVVFSWIQGRLFKPLPGVSGSASFYFIEPRNETGMFTGVSWLEFLDLQEQLRSYRDLIAFRMMPAYVGESGRVERAFGQLVSGNYFAALGLRPAIGRFLDPAEVSKPGGEPVVVISHGLWQARFSGDPSVLGQALRVNGRDLTIVGVTPRGFQGTVLGLNFDIWMPATIAAAMSPGSREIEDRTVRAYSVMGKLRPSVSRPQAQSELDGVMRQLAQAWPETNRTIRGEVLAFWESPRGPQRMLATALMVLQGIMLLLLLAVCGNTANLVLARASARQREMSVRLALGAGPRRIVRLLLTENLILGLLGAVLGTGIAVWGTNALWTLPLTGFPIKFQTEVDIFGLFFALALGVGCGLIFGAAPAIQLSRVEPQAAFRAATKGVGRNSMRNALMSIQVALALVVLIVAGLFLRSFMETRTTNPGFRRDGVMLAAYDLAGRDTSAAKTRAFVDRLLDRLRDLPSVAGAAVSSSVPLDIHGLPSRVFTVEGYTRTEPGYDQAFANVVTPGYFGVMEIPLLSGGDFVDLEDASTPPQVIVNEAFVRRYLSGLEPLGRRLQSRGGTFVITAVARNSLYNAFGEPPTPAIYFSYRDRPVAAGEIHVRARTGIETSVAQDVRRAVREIDPDLPVFNVRSLNDHVETNLVFRKIPARMFAVLGPLLLMLAAVGIYAVVAYTVSLRTTEIGVRLALGATGRMVVAKFMGDSLGYVALGGLVGWALAFVLATLFAPGGSVDFTVFAGVPCLLLLVAAAACWLPARRAARLDPIVALRQE